MNKTVRIITYNVNGIRAAVRKGLDKWLQAARPDIFCLQEIKANHDTFPRELFEALGYECYLYPAQKAGYSGVAVLSRKPAIKIIEGMNHPLHDSEGRVLRAFYDGFCVASVYMPSGSSGDQRQAVKMLFLDDFNRFVEKHRQEHPEYPLVICGDLNICHQAIDIHDPVRNANTSGFLPEERAWMSNFLASGFIDTFRHFNPEPHHYTWWSYRARAREKNLGWRIDYCMADKQLASRLQRAVILPEARHSDHCPVLLELAV